MRVPIGPKIYSHQLFVDRVPDVGRAGRDGGDQFGSTLPDALYINGGSDVQRDFIEDGDFIGEPYSLENQTVTMYPFNQQTEDRWIHAFRYRCDLAARSSSHHVVGRNLLNQEPFDVGSESADPGPPRQMLLSTTIRLGK